MKRTAAPSHGRSRPREAEVLLRDGARAARAAQLWYVRDGAPGWTRKKRGKGFAYFTQQGRHITEPADIERIRRLAIPPAWTSVWISPSPQGHIQATGFDAKGRKQYRYHERFRALRDNAKYEHILHFGRKLPALRRRLARDLARPGIDKAKVLSAMVELLSRTCIRVGNDRYAAENGSYGLTTLRDRHARIRGAALELQFKGKSGKTHFIRLDDARLARIVRRCKDVPGQRLFQYANGDGSFHAVTSGDINDYLQRVTGEPFSAKDFRTWTGTLLAVHALAACEAGTSLSARKREIKRALEQVSAELGNTVAVCRKSYVHPAVIDQYTTGALCAAFRDATRRAQRQPVTGLRRAEVIALRWLEALSRGRG